MTQSFTSAKEWLIARIGDTPQTALGWFRTGVAFYNKKEYNFAIECFQESIQLDDKNVTI
jgi:hypothetical protein